VQLSAYAGFVLQRTRNDKIDAALNHLAGLFECDILSYVQDCRAAASPGAADGRVQFWSPAMNVETILRNKGNWVATIRPDAAVADAVHLLHKERIGALVVSADGASVDGIVSERDVVIALAEHGENLLSLPVDAIMTRTVMTCEPADSVGDLMAEMTNRRIRHFPVVAGGRLCGIVSIGDLVKNRLDEIEFEASSLRSFIAGP
jgi:CBS-domain-containing membrane protein